ncbi:MAG: hypothetical protein JXB85_15885 [Anaerolineales bacterium]|nr:hypothetical protein [Anaerolineales bacterium]
MTQTPMRCPLDFTPPTARKPLFLYLLAWTLLLFAVFQALNAPLRTPAAPAGIVTFELARTPANAQAILDSWSHCSTWTLAAFGLGFDYLFMPSYAVTLALGVLVAAGRHPGWFARLGAWMGWAAFAAAILDALENLALFQIMLLSGAEVWPGMAFWCATIKFALLLAGILYGLTGWLWPKGKPAG